MQSAGACGQMDIAIILVVAMKNETHLKKQLRFSQNKFSFFIFQGGTVMKS